MTWTRFPRALCDALQWRHNGCDGVSNHQPHECLFNRLFGCSTKKTSNSASLAFVRGIHRWPVNSPHKWPVTRKMFPFDDVIMRNPPVICNGDLCSFVVSLNERLNEQLICMPVIGMWYHLNVRSRSSSHFRNEQLPLSCVWKEVLKYRYERCQVLRFVGANHTNICLTNALRYVRFIFSFGDIECHVFPHVAKQRTDSI